MRSLKLSFFQISPKVWADKNCLYARTSKFYRFFNLFFYSRTVVADRIKKHIEVKIKTFWFFTSKKYIPFNDIKYIDLERREKGMFGLTRTQAFTETWYVQIIRKSSPLPENLFRFIGDGGGDSHWDVIIPQFDVVGMQYEKALDYAKLVTKYTGFQLGEDHKIEYNTKVDHYKCLKCGHVSPSKFKCMYCGSKELQKIELTS